MVQGTQIQLARETIQPDDDILLPKLSDECPKNGNNFSPKCNKFSATPLDADTSCWCQCKTSTGKNTFFEPNNTCVPVTYARQTSGCDILFAGETTEGLLTFFPPTGINEKTVMVPENKTCSLQYGGNLYLQYLDCDGSWKEITQQSAKDSLEVTPGWSIRRLQIRSKPGTTFLASKTGRIIRIAVQCRDLNDINASTNSSTCAMFKVEGKVTCPLPQQSPTASATLPKPTAGNIIISTATLPPLPTTMQTSTATEPPTDKVTEAVGETTQQNKESGVQNPDMGAESGSTTSSKKNTFIIAGAVAGGILLVALIILIAWRCSSNPKKHRHPHSRLDGLGSISSPISQMSRHSMPVYTDAAHFAPIGSFSMRSGTSMDNLTYRRGSDGIILGPDFKRGSLYSDHYPSNPPPRPPSSKRSSLNGHVNPGLTLREEIVTMNPLFEGQIVEHKDLDALNCSDFAVHPDQVVVDDRKHPEAFMDDPDTYDCPEEILKGKPMTSTPVPVYYVVDEDPYPDSVSHTFRGDVRGRPDGHVYSEPETDILRRQDYVVMNGPNAVGYTHGYDEPRHNPNQGILKVGSVPPNSRRYDYDDDHMQVI